jgi:MarR family 2-MHQ and catechol resistance regulon transcriptional repressor
MRKKDLDEVIGDLLSLTPLIRRSIHRKLLKAAFTKVEEDVGMPHLEIMKILEVEGTRHIAEIGEHLQIPKPQMTHLIDRLEKLGIVQRQSDSSDRRITNVVLTDHGRTIVHDIDENLYASIAETLACLSDAELRDLSVSLKKLGDLLTKL